MGADKELLNNKGETARILNEQHRLKSAMKTQSSDMEGVSGPPYAAEHGHFSTLQLSQHLDKLWERAHAAAYSSGAVDAGVFAEIRQLNQNGTL